MISNEQIITNAKNRWRSVSQTEALICEIRSLLADIEDYRELIIIIDRAVRERIDKLRRRGGE